MKGEKGVRIFILFLVVALCFSFVSASWFSDTLNNFGITGNVISATDACAAKNGTFMKGNCPANYTRLYSYFTYSCCKSKIVSLPSTPNCTSFTYSDWSICLNNQQTRTVLTSSPINCINGNPVLSQSCTIQTPTYPKCCCGRVDPGNNYSYIRNISEENVCSNLGFIVVLGNITRPSECGQTCLNNAVITCTSFTYSDWSSCENNVQTRTVLTSSPTNCINGNPVLSQSCTIQTPTYPKCCCGPDNDYSVIDNSASELSCLDIGYQAINAFNLSRPTDCSSVCRNNPFNQTKCTDSDGGLDFYKFGQTSGLQGNKIDSCLNNITLSENYCAANGTQMQYSFTCHSGYICSNGACVIPTTSPVQNKNITSFGTYEFQSGDYIIINKALVRVVILEYSQCADENCTFTIKKSSVRFYYPTRSTSYHELVVGESVTLMDKNAPMDSFMFSDVSAKVINISINGDGNENNELTNTNKAIIELKQLTYDCNTLVDFVKDPILTSDKYLYSNWSYACNSWINNNQENCTEYGAFWSWNNPQHQQGQVNYYTVSYDIQVFDNKNLNLSGEVSWNKDNPVCKANSYWVDGKQNFYYICNWDALDDNQDLSTNYKNNNRQLIWYNGNVIVRMYLHWGDELTDAQVQKLSEKKVIDLINNLKNNNFKYTDWNNFDVVYPVTQVLSDSFKSCSSDLVIGEADSKIWNCKIEPVICPEHGYQTRICQAWNSQTQKNEVQTNQISCSPGICSGCYVPRWFGYSGDNTCIPYGFRFSSQQLTQQSERLTERVGSGIPNSEDLKIISSTEAIVTFYGKYTNTSYNLIKGKSIEINVPDVDKKLNVEWYVEDIVPSEDNVTGYVDVSISTPITFNAYCDINGQVGEQKSHQNGEWASCQNNYECDSNLCSYGECVDLKSIVNEAGAIKAWFVKTVCKLSHLFQTAEQYDQCVYSYLEPAAVVPTTAK